MTESVFATIRNYRLLNYKLATSGQPSEAHFQAIAAAGYEVVVNLALHDDPRYSLADETATVEALGMKYQHIPVQFSEPTEANLLDFFTAMTVHHDQKIWVHCAANWRVAVFIGLFQCIVNGKSEAEAFKVLNSTWQPNEVWSSFIAAILAKHCSTDHEI